VYNLAVEPIHLQALDAARERAGEDWTFRAADVLAALPHLNAATVRTHVASRCCVNARANHQTRYRYFRAVARGRYRIEPAYRRRAAALRSWTDALLSSVASGIDSSLIAESLAVTPTERLEVLQRAARSLEALRRP
jgi:hypothetical protein